MIVQVILRFSIANMSTIQFKTNECKIHDNIGNDLASFSSQSHVGLTDNLSFIRSVPYYPCTGLDIRQTVILPHNTFYVATGGGGNQCNSIRYDWHSDNITYNLGNWITVGSKSANGSTNWKYSWYTNGNSASEFRLISLSYGLVWAGPESQY